VTTAAIDANAGRPWPMPDSIDTEGKSLWQLVEERVARSPDKIMAVDEQDRRWTYTEFRDWCERVAAGLSALGVREGTNVSWILPSRIEAFVLIGALARLGAVQNPILPIYRHREVGFITRQTGCRLLVVPGTFRNVDYEKMAREATADLDVEVLVAAPDLPEGDPQTLGPPASNDGDPVRWLFYTSGTVADPKGAKHTDASIAAANLGMQWSLRCDGGDRVAVVFPITHVGGVVWMFNTMETGAELLLVEIFSPMDSPRFLAEHGVTVAGAGTVFWQAYLAAQRTQPDRPLFPDVRVFAGGGAPKPPNIHDELMTEMGAPAMAGWGLTEAPINTMMELDSPDEKKASTEGRACPGVSLRTITVDGALGRPGEEGELQVRGAQVCLGYLDSTLDADGFTTDDDGHRWFRTGDLGVIDADGYVTITGRLKDIIIRKGENISAKEIEDLLFAHPKVADVAVIGVPDPASGERACAVVVCVDGEELTFLEMVEHLRATDLTSQKLPEQLELVDTLPRNPSGKVLKRELRQQFA
jgi:acyl-CoA synthetase (AMP-forming)/AMP-acid ligase II